MQNEYLKKWPVDPDLIQDLRQRFLSEINYNPEDAELYHPDDIKRVRENDWFICRYILHQNKNVDEAFRMLKESLKYRKDLEINTVKRADLPAEYFNVRAVITYNKDKRNHPLVVIRTKVHIKNEKTRRLQQQYMLYWVEKAVRASDWGVVSILFDCTDAGVSNMDMDMIRFIMNVFKKYYPWGLYSFIVCNMPWYLSAFWKVIKGLIPEQYIGKITFVDLNAVKEHIDEDELPVILGGRCTKLYEPKEGAEEDFEGENEISAAMSTSR